MCLSLARVMVEALWSAVRGILKLAYKLLVNDRAKFTALLLGITFAVFLMMFITSMFVGVLKIGRADV